MSTEMTDTATQEAAQGTPHSRMRCTLPRLIVDTREQTPLTFLHLEAVRGTLATGDYSIEGMQSLFGAERKSTPDLVSSLTTRREPFFRELERGRGMAFFRLLIIGTPLELTAHLNRRGVTAESIAGSLAAINARLVPVVWVPTPEMAARLVERWAVYFWAGAARPFIGKVDVPAWCREGVLDNWKG